MDIDRVRYFNIFADTGSLVKASEILHISQPALSKAIKVLESEVGLQLVEADGRGLKLTQAGQRLREESSALLAHWLDLPKKIHEQEKWQPTRIASFEVFTTYFLGHLSDFLALENLEIHEFTPGQMERAVSEGKADIGITYLPIPQLGVEFLEVGNIKMGVFGLEKFSKEEFKSLPFVIPILPREGTPSRVIGLDGWPDHKIERKVKFKVTMMESALELCRRGLAVAYLPEFVAYLHNRNVLKNFRLKELETPITQRERLQSVHLISPKGATETELHRKIAKCIRALK